jgi:predicted MPP superfamily phosphohydrolase
MMIVGWLWLVGACVGHLVGQIYCANRWFGSALNHHIQTVMRLSHGLLTVAGWWVFADFFRSTSLAGTSQTPETAWMQAIWAYGLFCCALAFGALPANLAARRRRRSQALLHNHTQTIDVAAELGYKPAGHGKRRWMARLPGNNIFTVDFTEKAVYVPRLPAAWDGLTILQLTDLHFHGVPSREFFQYVMDVCRDCEPDLLAVTGDIVDSAWHYRWILPLLGRLRWRIAAFAILGNHDSWFDPERIRRRLARLNIDVLGNSWRLIQVRGEPMVVIGNEAPWIGPAPDLRTCPDGIFQLCLSHTPDNIPWARHHGIDLMLAGHNHGGQVRLPVVGPVFVPSRYGRRYDGGVYDEGPTVLHVCRGLAGRDPLRYNCHPEVAKIVLRQGELPRD